MERIRKTRLERLAAQVNKELGRPERFWDYSDGRNIAHVGHISTNNAPIYGGWDLVEVTSESGGERSIIGNNGPGDRGRLKAHEMESFLLGMLAAIERLKVPA